MSWAAVIGAGVGLAGTYMAGQSAEENAQANQDEQRRLLAQQYGWTNNSRFNLTGDLYGGDAIKRLRGTTSREDFDSRFGSGAFEFLDMTPEQQAELRAGRPAPGAKNPNNALVQEFNASYRPGMFQGQVVPGFNQQRHTPQELAQQREQAFTQFIKQKTGQAPTGEEMAAFRYNQELPVNAARQFDPTALDDYNKAFGGRGILGELEDQAGLAEREGNAQMDNYVSNTNHLQGMFGDTLRDYDRASGDLQSRFTGVYNDAATRAKGTEALASDWGQGRDKIIREDAARDLAGQNQVSQARLGAMGFGNSSLVGNQLASNANESSRTTARSLQDLAEGQVDRQLAVRGANNSMLTGLQTGNLGTMERRAGGRTGLQTGNIDMMNSRFAGGSAMGQDNLNRNIALREKPINTRLSLLTHPLMNPGTGIQTSSFYSPSGAGATGSAFGGFMGNMGGRLFANGLNTGGSSSSGNSDYRNDPNYIDHMNAYGR